MPTPTDTQATLGALDALMAEAHREAHADAADAARALAHAHESGEADYIRTAAAWSAAASAAAAEIDAAWRTAALAIERAGRVPTLEAEWAGTGAPEAMRG